MTYALEMNGSDCIKYPENMYELLSEPRNPPRHTVALAADLPS